jgi:hypothetical protein
MNLILRQVLVLLFFSLIACENLRTFLRDRPDDDPYQSFSSLEQWEFDSDLLLPERIMSLLRPLTEVVQINVVLVGFDNIPFPPVGKSFF